MPGLPRVRDYKDLVVWQRAVELAALCHQVVAQLPRGERGDLASQVRRAAISVPANIAEGHSRPGRGDFHGFLSIAYASLKELECHLLLVRRIHQDSEALTEALGKAEECSRMLTSLRRRLASKGSAPAPRALSASIAER